MVDVARLAGVAIGTVSNTLNNPDMVSEDRRLRVLAAIEELGFVRNGAARSLITGSSDLVGLVIVDLRDPYLVDVARGLDAELHESGLRLLIADSDGLLEKQRENIQLFEQSRVAGIVLISVGEPSVDSSRPTGLCPLVTMVVQSPADRRQREPGSAAGRAAGRMVLARIRSRRRPTAHPDASTLRRGSGVPVPIDA